MNRPYGCLPRRVRFFPAWRRVWNPIPPGTPGGHKWKQNRLNKLGKKANRRDNEEGGGFEAIPFYR